MIRRTGAALAEQWRAFMTLPDAVRRRFVVMVLPWLAAFALGLPILWTQFNAIADAPRWHNREILRDESAEIVRRTLDSLEHDAMFLSDLSGRLPSADTWDDSPMGRLFLSFTRTAGAYDKVRWIGRDGHERLVVRETDGAPVLLGVADLRDRSGEAYFKEAATLPEGGIYVSPVELNMEDGLVGQAVDPTLFAATPLYRNGQFDGVIVINYRATRLLDRLMELGQRQGLEVYLLNDQAYWLQGPEPRDSWAWQLQAPERAVSLTEPGLWRAMQQADAGRYSDGSGDWSFRRVRINPEVAGDRDTVSPLRSDLGLRIAVRTSPDLMARSDWSWRVPLALVAACVLFFSLRYAWQAVSSLVEESRRAAELRAANQALTQANDNLRNVQADLYRAERLSSLGLMVAGVAHELNTPLGSASLALSTLQQGLATLQERMGSGLRRSDLETFASNSDQAAELAQSAVGRAAGIVRRFKQVAVDRTAMERRVFDLAQILLDADPRLTKWDESKGILLRLDLAPGLSMNSYPGPLEQVVSNLLSNALSHAFRGRDRGSITLQSVADGPHHVVVRMTDDGVGIEEDEIGRIFDPFYTTSRHAGGTGLGLHIVSQLVDEVLGGTINVRSHAGGTDSGTTFTMRLPR